MNPAAPRGGFGWSLLAISGGLALGFASPPTSTAVALLPLLLGLMAWFALATGSPRPGRHAYLFGCVHMAWFSWAVRHFQVGYPAYAAIVLVGGLYYGLAARLTRAAPRWRGFAFVVAGAGTFWLRAVMPEIHYPHGQPCHSLWTAPWLLSPITVGGEPLVNALLAAFAASLVEVGRSWRTARPRWGRAWLAVAAVAGLWAMTALLGTAWRAACVSERGFTVAAIEPGFHPMDELEDAYARGDRERGTRLRDERLLAPSEQVLAAADVDLLLWPESSVPDELLVADVEAGREVFAFRDAAGRARLRTSGRCRLLLGAAVLVELRSGKVLGHQAKRVLVPAGEFLPFARWMPASWLAWVAEQVKASFGQELPACVPGEERPPLVTADGGRFGVLLCYDNAYPDFAAAQVAAGAQLLCVLSNESWFRNGNELSELVAMSVCRALETATPLVRCTQDGWSVVVGADGCLRECLPIVQGRQPAARILRATVPAGAGALPAMAWLRAATGPFCGGLLALMFLHTLVRRARLRSAPPAPPATGGFGSSGVTRGTGS